jgi:hypothetical protein
MQYLVADYLHSLICQSLNVDIPYGRCESDLPHCQYCITEPQLLEARKSKKPLIGVSCPTFSLLPGPPGTRRQWMCFRALPGDALPADRELDLRAETIAGINITRNTAQQHHCATVYILLYVPSFWQPGPRLFGVDLMITDFIYESRHS